MKMFTLFLGLNDKDSKMQEINTLDAYKIVNNLTCKEFGGGTISEAFGIYTHDNGQKVEEKTLRIELMNTTDEKVAKFSNELKTLFNQESIMVVPSSVEVMFI